MQAACYFLSVSFSCGFHSACSQVPLPFSLWPTDFQKGPFGVQVLPNPKNFPYLISFPDGMQSGHIYLFLQSQRIMWLNANQWNVVCTPQKTVLRLSYIGIARMIPDRNMERRWFCHLLVQRILVYQRLEGRLDNGLSGSWDRGFLYHSTPESRAWLQSLKACHHWPTSVK